MYNWKNSGLSLLEITVVLGLTSAISLGFMRLMNNQQKSLTSTKSRVEENLIVNQMAIILRKEESCAATLSDAGVLLGQDIPSIIGVHPTDPAAGVRFNTGGVYGGGIVEIERMTLVNRNIPPGGGVGQAEIEIYLRRIGAGSEAFGADVKKYTISLQVHTTPLAPTAIHRCFTDHLGVNESALESTCNIMGGIFDTVTDSCRFECQLGTPSDLVAISTECLMDTDVGGLGQMDPLFINSAGGDTYTNILQITGYFTSNNELYANVLTGASPQIVANNFAALGPVTLGGVAVATTDMLFENLTEADKETILADIVTTTASQTGTNAVIDDSRQALSVISAPCAGAEGITSVSYNSATGQFSYTCGAVGTDTCPQASDFCSGTTFDDGVCTVAGSKDCCPAASLICSGDTYVNPALGCNVVGSRSCVARIQNTYPVTRSKPTGPDAVCFGTVVWPNGSPFGAWSATCASSCTNGTFVSETAATCDTYVSPTDCTPATECSQESKTLTCECDV